MLSLVRRFLSPVEGEGGGGGDAAAAADKAAAAGDNGAIKIEYEGKQMTVAELQAHIKGRETEYQTQLTGIKNLHPFLEAVGKKDRAAANAFIDAVFGKQSDAGGEGDDDAEPDPTDLKGRLDKVERSLSRQQEIAEIDKVFTTVSREAKSEGFDWTDEYEDKLVDFMKENGIHYKNLKWVHERFQGNQLREAAATAKKTGVDAEAKRKKDAEAAAGGGVGGRARGAGADEQKARPGESLDAFLSRTGKKLQQPA